MLLLDFYKSRLGHTSYHRLLLLDKASPRAFRQTKATNNAELFGANPNVANMFSKIANGEMGKGSPFGM